MVKVNLPASLSGSESTMEPQVQCQKCFLTLISHIETLLWLCLQKDLGYGK